MRAMDQRWRALKIDWRLGVKRKKKKNTGTAAVNAHTPRKLVVAHTAASSWFLQR